MGLFKKSAAGADRDTTDTVLFDVWGQRGWHNVEVVGESHHTREIRALFPAHLNSSGQELTIPVTITHEIGNPHDKNAVQVCASTGVLGHLSREDAARYAPALSRLQARGKTPATTARVWGQQGYFDSDSKEFVGSVRLDLPDPHMLQPTNQSPTVAHAILPVGAAVQVTGEEKHMAAIAPFLNAHGECWVHATLHEFVEQSARSTKTLAEVRIDGQPVGRLTPKMSGDMLPAVNYLAHRGKQAVVRAIVKGNALKAEVVLYTKRSSELPADWFNQGDAPGASVIADSGGTQTRTGAAANGVADPHTTASSTIDEPAPSPLDLSPPPPLPPANWYPDPHDAAYLRYWDGARWTEHTAPAARR